MLQTSCDASCMRSQWPRAGHSGVKHWTVQPGKYCIGASQSERAEFVEPEKRPKNQRDCAPGRLVCQGKYIQLVGVAFPPAQGGGFAKFGAAQRSLSETTGEAGGVAGGCAACVELSEPGCADCSCAALSCAAAAVAA